MGLKQEKTTNLGLKSNKGKREYKRSVGAKGAFGQWFLDAVTQLDSFNQMNLHKSNKGQSVELKHFYRFKRPC